METGLDLTKASRETLLAVIAELQDTNAGLRRRVESLEARLSAAGPRGRMPGHKPAGKGRQPCREKSSGKGVPTALPGGGRNPPAGWSTLRSPARNATPPCPGGWVQRTREVIDIPVAPAEVTEHVFMARLCPLCRKRRLPQAPLRGLAVGRQRLGVNLVSLIVTLREEGRLPVRTIQWYLRTFHQLKLSVGAIVRAVHQVARHGGTAVAETLERIRSSPVVHADETG